MSEKITFSVAMATYNGAKYIEKQLQSIVDQTVAVDEIVISDDGSKDDTLKIAEKVLSSSGITYRIIKNQGKHCSCKNFENAVKNCTGDYIFLADQDDIWLPEKVEVVMKTIEENPGVMGLFHDMSIIDENDKVILTCDHEKYPDGFSCLDPSRYPDGFLSMNTYLENAVTDCLFNGMLLCINNAMLQEMLPFPEIIDGHDHWIEFLLLCNNSLYHIPGELAQYRLHGENTSGLGGIKKNRLNVRLKKIFKRVKMNRGKNNYLLNICFPMQEKLEKAQLTNTDAYRISERLVGLGLDLKKIYSKPKIIGFFSLIIFYCKDMRYRGIGKKNFIQDLLGVMWG